MPETAEQYRNRMYSHVHGREPLALLAAAPKKLESLIKGVAAAKLRRRPAPGKWSICEIVAHLGDTELVGGHRIRTILGAPGAQIQAFDQDQWAAAMQYQKRNVRQSLEGLISSAGWQTESFACATEFLARPRASAG